MIVFDLQCSRNHRFEAWFKDGAAFDGQAAAGEVTCPECGDTRIAKAPMAPHLARGTEAEPQAKQALAVREALHEIRRVVETTCDYVGDRFADEARRIHYGETAKRDIYGEATVDEARELVEEGVKVAPVPWPRREDS
ncbi:MAG: DUF1178 family protein [Alphaproteobacteria bacterium]|nr:DUF1178 family protein [Alphaproteobacteria bacterium]